MIKIKDISKTYKLGKTSVPALKHFNLSIEKGEFISIMGPSGSGKTTLLNIIGCLDLPDTGEVWIDNIDVLNIPRRKLSYVRAEKIGFIFQSFNLIPVLNVYENIELPFLINKTNISKKERKERIQELIYDVGLENHIKHKPDELSGGQRQRVAIARALVTNPAIVLADEPTANLDSETGKKIIELMRDIRKQYNTTFVFSTHDPAIVEYAEKLYQLRDGRLKLP